MGRNRAETAALREVRVGVSRRPNSRAEASEPGSDGLVGWPATIDCARRDCDCANKSCARANAADRGFVAATADALAAAAKTDAPRAWLLRGRAGESRRSPAALASDIRRGGVVARVAEGAVSLLLFETKDLAFSSRASRSALRLTAVPSERTLRGPGGPAP